MTLFDRLQEETQEQQARLNSLPLIRHGLKGDISKQQYIAFLTEAYHHVKHTVPLMMACGYNLIDKARWVQDFMAGYIREEIGHEQWILNDIEAAGGDADLAKTARPSAACEIMVSYAYDTINRVNAYGFFGMIFVLEGTSVQLASHAAEAIQKKLQLPDAAFIYLTSHGEIDQEHIVFLQTLLNKVEKQADKDWIVHTAKRFFKLYGDIFNEIWQA